MKKFVRRKRQRRYRNCDEEWIWFRFANDVAENSSCVRRKVGAILVNPMHGMVSCGWNLEKDGRMCDEDCPRAHSGLPPASSYDGAGRCIATHAEIMAIERARTLEVDQMTGCHIYVTCAPCGQCSEVLANLGIKVHYEKEYR